MAFLIGGANTLDSSFNIDNSCRFDSASSGYMYKSHSASQTKKFTISFWVKRGKLGTSQRIFHTGQADGDPAYFINFDSSDRLFIGDMDSSYVYQHKTNAVFRDPSAWYHIVHVVDTAQGAANDRSVIYINGKNYRTYANSYANDDQPALNGDSELGTGNDNIVIGRDEYDSGSAYFDGYLAELYYADNAAYNAEKFGEFDSSTGIWKPIEVTGISYGTNGFYLDFKASGNLGNDANGGTDLTESGFAADHQTTDTPTNNFMTMNPLSQYGITFAEGNLSVQGANSSGYSVCTGGWEVPSSGKWYYEVEVDVFGGTNHEYLGIKRDDLTLEATAYDLHSSTCQFYQSNDGSNGSFRDEGSTTATATALRHSAGDILMVAIDISNEKMWFGKNGTWYDDDATTDGDPANGTNPTCTPNNDYTWHFFSGGGNNAVKYLYNFGNPPFSISSGNTDANGYGNFEYAVPSGYYALCTKNLAKYG